MPPSAPGVFTQQSVAVGAGGPESVVNMQPASKSPMNCGDAFLFAGSLIHGGPAQLGRCVLFIAITPKTAHLPQKYDPHSQHHVATYAAAKVVDMKNKGILLFIDDLVTHRGIVGIQLKGCLISFFLLHQRKEKMKILISMFPLQTRK